MQVKCMHALQEGGAHMHGAMLCGGHGLKRARAPAGQLAALRGLVPQLRILLDGLQGSGLQHSSWISKARPWILLNSRCFCTCFCWHVMSHYSQDTL